MTASPPPWGALPVLLCGTFVALLDIFVVNVAAPSIREGLDASEAAMQWIVAGYVLPYAVLLITGGRIGDLLGRRRAFQLGMGLFTLASAACGAAPTIGVLIGARAVQGAGAALMTPQVLATFQVAFGPADRQRCMAWFGGVVGAASALGQLVGGVLIAVDVLGLGWRAIFLLNVPVGIVAVLAARGRVPQSLGTRGRRLDVGGVALSGLALLLVVFPAVQGREAGWPWWVPACAAGAAAAGALWVRHEAGVTARGEDPLVDLGLFRLPGFAPRLATVVAMYAAAPCLFLLLGIYLQDGHGLSAIASAGVFTPLALVFVGASFAGPRLVERHGERALGVAASITATSALLLATCALADPSGVPYVPLGLALGLMGLGQGIVMPGAVAAVLRTVPGEHAGAASGVVSTAQQVGNVLGVAGAGTVYFAVLGPAATATDHSEAFAVATGWTATFAVVGALCALAASGARPRFRRPLAVRGG